jgi:hypothetical protein
MAAFSCARYTIVLILHVVQGIILRYCYRQCRQLSRMTSSTLNRRIILSFIDVVNELNKPTTLLPSHGRSMKSVQLGRQTELMWKLERIHYVYSTRDLKIDYCRPMVAFCLHYSMSLERLNRIYCNRRYTNHQYNVNDLASLRPKRS